MLFTKPRASRLRLDLFLWNGKTHSPQAVNGVVGWNAPLNTVPTGGFKALGSVNSAVSCQFNVSSGSGFSLVLFQWNQPMHETHSGPPKKNQDFSIYEKTINRKNCQKAPFDRSKGRFSTNFWAHSSERSRWPARSQESNCWLRE